jgi:hypothetical protein
MKQLFTPFATFLFLALAACTDSSGYEIAKAPIVPAPPVIPLVPIVTDLAAVEVGIEKANLFAREPDTCHAADYQDLLGQNAQEIETREWSRPFRIVAVGGIVTQEYAANRINFSLDTQGLVYKINCG